MQSRKLITCRAKKWQFSWLFSDASYYSFQMHCKTLNMNMHAVRLSLQDRFQSYIRRTGRGMSQWQLHQKQSEHTIGLLHKCNIILINLSAWPKLMHGRQQSHADKGRTIRIISHSCISFRNIDKFQQQLWLEFKDGLWTLSGYHYTIAHKPGCNEGTADGLSRLPLATTPRGSP